MPNELINNVIKIGIIIGVVFIIAFAFLIISAIIKSRKEASETNKAKTSYSHAGNGNEPGRLNTSERQSAKCNDSMTAAATTAVIMSSSTHSSCSSSDSSTSSCDSSCI